MSDTTRKSPVYLVRRPSVLDLQGDSPTVKEPTLTSDRKTENDLPCLTQQTDLGGYGGGLRTEPLRPNRHRN